MRRAPLVDVGAGLAMVEGPTSAPPPDTATATEDGVAARTPPTQRRLGPRAGGEEVAAGPSTTAPAPATTRTRADRGLLRSELLPLLLLGGAVAAAYVACLQVAMRRREARETGPG